MQFFFSIFSFALKHRYGQKCHVHVLDGADTAIHTLRPQYAYSRSIVIFDLKQKKKKADTVEDTALTRRDTVMPIAQPRAQ
jgi:hypothetical protein